MKWMSDPQEIDRGLKGTEHAHQPLPATPTYRPVILPWRADLIACQAVGLAMRQSRCKNRDGYKR